MKNSKKEDKIYTEKDLVKAMYKAVLKKMKSNYKDVAEEIVDDVLDPNDEAQVDPDKIPVKKPKVMNKAKGIDKLKKFQKSKNRCWDGYEPTPGKKPYSEDSCRKKK